MQFSCGTCNAVYDKWRARCTCGVWDQVKKVSSSLGPIADRVPADRVPVARGSGERESSDGLSGDRGGIRREVASASSDASTSSFSPSESEDLLSPPASVPVFVADVAEEEIERIPTGIEPLDRVLGGGLVPASIVLLGGERGIGKSTLLVQVVDGFPCKWSLYASGEETVGQIANRVRRLNCVNPQLRLLYEQNIDRILSHAVELGVDLLIVDSIQTMFTSRIKAAPGTSQQVKACTELVMTFSRRYNAKVIIIGQLLKDGDFAGPESLQHLVDVILSFEQHEEIPALRRLRCAGKNRYGSALEVGEFEMRADGLAPISRVDTEDREARRLMDRESSSKEDSFRPIAQELVYQLLENGIQIDEGLIDRMAGRLDLVPRSNPAVLG